jgi:cell division septation protein DedD
VNDTGEATHYQVELTSRQVLAALVVLLICLFASFFAGVWIGRNAEADSAAHELASVDPVARAGERFDFFSRTTVPPGGAGDAAAAAAENDESATDSDDADTDGALDENAFGPDPEDAELEMDGADPADPEDLFEDDPAALGGESGLEPPEQMGRGGRRRRAAARAQDATGAAVENETETGVTVVGGSAAAPTRSAAPTLAPAPVVSGFHIQVLATSDRAKADALVSRLVDADFTAFIVPSTEGGRAMYRVRVGPFSDRALATRQAAELESRWGLESWISPGAP